MTKPARPIAFVLVASQHGSMIVNRNDYHINQRSEGYGVGYQILQNSCFDIGEVELALALLSLRRAYFGDGVMALDCGANIGVHTIEWARHMHGWGRVHGFEAQEHVFYALAGNVAINNCMNACVVHAAVGAENGSIMIPIANPFKPASYGSLELRQNTRNEYIGQAVSYAPELMQGTPLRTIDSYAWQRVDFIKIDVEGMELEVLTGAQEAISQSKPIILLEIIKSDKQAIQQFLAQHEYHSYRFGINLLCIHAKDPTLGNIQKTGTGYQINTQRRF